MKKSISLLLLGILLGTVFPASAQIATGTSGTCTWTLADDGTLTVTSGTLAAWDTQAPWANYAAQVRTVSIPAEAGTVSATTLHAMFQGMGEATTFDLSGLLMTFPGDRKACQDLFDGCTALRMLTLPAQTDIVWESTALTIAGGCRLQVVGTGTAWHPLGASFDQASLATGLTTLCQSGTKQTLVLTKSLTADTYTLSSASGLGTFCYPVAVSLTESDGGYLADAYTVTGMTTDPTATDIHEGDYVLVLHYVGDGESIPAHTPVIVYKPGGATLALSAVENASIAPVPVEQEGNWLAGCYTTFSIAGDRDYVMQNKKSHGVAFYPVNPSRPVSAKAFRSFLRLPADAPEVAALALQLPASPTAIAPVSPCQSVPREGIYTLSGQPVEHMRPGQVYILNGHKVVVR